MDSTLADVDTNASADVDVDACADVDVDAWADVDTNALGRCGPGVDTSPVAESRSEPLIPHPADTKSSQRPSEKQMNCFDMWRAQFESVSLDGEARNESLILAPDEAEEISIKDLAVVGHNYIGHNYIPGCPFAECTLVSACAQAHACTCAAL